MSGDRGSVSGVLVCWSLDLGSTPDGSLSFSFPLDHLGLSMLTSKLNIEILVNKIIVTIILLVCDLELFKIQSYSYTDARIPASSIIKNRIVIRPSISARALKTLALDELLEAPS